MSLELPRINFERLRQRLDELGRIGATPEGGVRRLAATGEDGAGRDLVCQWMRDLGLTVEIDRIGNIFATRDGDETLPPVMTGSHIDTVGNAGLLDGCYGVLAGLEVIETLNEAALRTRHPLCVAVFTNEEGVRFQPDMMGSLVHAGGMDVETALASTDRDGTSLGKALASIGYAGTLPCGNMQPQAFVELHIEQGPVLEREGLPIGVVADLQGISWTEIEIEGQANHAGTTPMGMRRDAGFCAAAIMHYLRDICDRIGDGQVATCGHVKLTPDLINVVPSRALLTVDLRNSDEGRLQQAEQLLQQRIERLEAEEQVKIATRRLARFEPVRFSEDVVRRIEASATGLGLAQRRMTSGAGHDAQMMARICPSAMIFVPSRDGISHNPAEFTEDKQLRDGADLLLHSMVDLATGA